VIIGERRTSEQATSPVGFMADLEGVDFFKAHPVANGVGLANGHLTGIESVTEVQAEDDAAVEVLGTSPHRLE